MDDPSVLASWPPPRAPVCSRTAGQLIRQRRSAVDFDGFTAIPRATFLQILDATLPRRSAAPFDAWPYAARIHLVLFVHRVTGLAPGLYVWVRAREDLAALRSAFFPELDWEPPPGTEPAMPLYRLAQTDVREFAQAVSCGQSIAADGAFSLGMVARFESVLRDRGSSAYRELFWEAGMIGQALYLAAEAAGVRGTGIGCYLDDMMHQALGLKDHAWQSLYHFTIGGPVDDPRLRTLPPYGHLRTITKRP